MKGTLFRASVMLLGWTPLVAVAEDDPAVELRKELDSLRSDYEQRIERLETRIRELEKAPKAAPSPKPPKAEPGRQLARPARPKPQAATKEVPAAGPAVDPQAVELAARKAADKQFEEDTEIRDLARRPDAEDTLAARVEDVLNGYIDITGYFRAGYGRSDEGGPQQAFGIPGVAKYRLGNEAENYGELAFAKTFYPAGFFTPGSGAAASDPVARMTYRMAFYNPYNNYGAASDTEFSSPEIWGSLANVIPGQPEAKVWAGNRYYRRHDIHLNDFYFWDMSGGGGGIEDFVLGNGKLAFAWIGDGAESSIYGHLGEPDPANLAGFSKTSFDLRYYDWNFLGGLGEVGLVYSRTSSGVDELGRQAEDADGVALHLVWTDQGFLDEESLHKVSLQLGNGPAKTFTSGFDTFSNTTGTYIRPDPNESWRFRFTDQVVVKPIEQLALGGALVYQYTDYGNGAPEQQWVSGGVRPIWYFTDSISLAFEGGVDWVSEAGNGNRGTLCKFTLAPQISLGDQFFSRPVLRAFVTYATWTDGLEGLVGGPDYANRSSGWSWGLQMEAWW